MKPIIVKSPRYMIDNAAYCLIVQRLRQQAAEKVIQVEEVITSPRFDGLLRRLSYTLIMALGVMVAVGVIMAVVR